MTDDIVSGNLPDILSWTGIMPDIGIRHVDSCESNGFNAEYAPRLGSGQAEVRRGRLNFRGE